MRTNPEGPVEFALRYTPPIAGILAVAACLISGPKSSAGFALGAALSLASLWSGTWIVRATIHERTNRISAILRLEFLFLMKLPIFMGAALLANWLGFTPLCYFLAGYLLVYFALTVGAILRGSAPAISE